MRSQRDPLAALFDPRSVAVIGATERDGSVGRALMTNLLAGPSTRAIYPVNPNHTALFERRCFARVTDIGEPLDLAVIVTPAATVPDIVAQCVTAGVRSAIIVSAGFKELGPAGAALEREILQIKRGADLRIVGPNCLGLINPYVNLNASFAARAPSPGHIAFLSQSGALCSAILDWSLSENVGFSAFVSTGSMLDVSWSDLIDYLADDPRTKSILIYMESIADARSFMSAAREAALDKPIVILKAGRSTEAAHAAMSHTGAMVGSDDVLDAAFRRAGVLRVNRVAELFHMAEVLSKQPEAKGPRLAIVTNAGGAGVLATDALVAAGGALASLAPATIDALSRVLPPHWSHANPVDVLGDADPARYAKAATVVAEDPQTDGVLVLLTPQEMSDPSGTASEVVSVARGTDKPILANWMGGEAVEEGASILRRANIPVFNYPDDAARAFQQLWNYSKNLQALYETPAPCSSESTDISAARAVIDAARRERRTSLTEAEAKRLIAAYGISAARLEVAHNADEAAACADAIGYPVAAKLLSHTITHKTDVGGVILDLPTSTAVRDAFETIRERVTRAHGAEHFEGVSVQPMIRDSDSYELIIGSKTDPQFGPVILFGVGGQLVELMHDRAIGLPPLNRTLARRVIERTNIARILRGVRGRKPVNQGPIEETLIRFSQLVLDHPRLKEIEINPLLVSPTNLVALDARVSLWPEDVADVQLPQPAIRPYPQAYVAKWTSADGLQVVIRPIRPEDEQRVVEFHRSLSDTSVQSRYFHAMSFATRTTHERLSRVCFTDHDREIALVAETSDTKNGGKILAIARLIKTHAKQAEFAIVVADEAQGHGLGSELLKQLVNVARTERVQTLRADVLRSNTNMLDLCRRLHFGFSDELSNDVVRVTLSLKALENE
jgi:acetyltransferase